MQILLEIFLKFPRIQRHILQEEDGVAAGFRSAVGLSNCKLKICNSKPFALKNVSKKGSGALPSPEPPGEELKN